MELHELTALVSDLRSEGSDFAEVEVKQAATSFPQSAVETLCAFANTPGGGLLILGLDENDGFRATGVTDPAAQQVALAATCRNALDPPITFSSEVHRFEGAHVVVAHINELASSSKPCRVGRTHKAYLRAYDGDYELSQLEEQAFIANRETPRFDQAQVPDATPADLDTSLLRSYLDQCRLDPALDRFTDDDILLKTGVTLANGGVSVAGLLALGSYPQQYLPNYMIQGMVVPDSDAPEGTRAVDPKRFGGPIPLILDEAITWVQRNTRTRIVFGHDGHGRDEPEYPAQAVRELISNALIHRDLGPHAGGQAITIRIEKSRLIVSNPGGLWGIAASQLGKTQVSSARNGYLLRICQNVRTRRGGRIVEALATGIPTILTNLERAGMVPPLFNDQGIRFAVVVPNHSLLAKSDLDWLSTLPDNKTLSDTQKHVLVGMHHGVAWTNRTLRAAFPMDSRDARSLMLDLVSRGLARAEGEKGNREYELADEFDDQDDLPPDQVELDLPEIDEESGRRPHRRLTTASRILEALGGGALTRRQLASALGLTDRQVEYAMAYLRDQRLVVLDGKQGNPNSRYRLFAEPESVGGPKE